MWIFGYFFWLFSKCSKFFRLFEEKKHDFLGFFQIFQDFFLGLDWTGELWSNRIILKLGRIFLNTATGRLFNLHPLLVGSMWWLWLKIYFYIHLLWQKSNLWHLIQYFKLLLHKNKKKLALSHYYQKSYLYTLSFIYMCSLADHFYCHISPNKDVSPPPPPPQKTRF